jgi:hypothetical protein
MTRVAVLGLSLGGVLLGHALTYAGLAPGALAREALLSATGHGYLGPANRLGLLVTVGVLAAVFLGRLTRAPAAEDLGRPLGVRLVAFQVLAFAAMEVAERIGAHADPRDLVQVLPAGLVIQVGVALAIAAIVRWLLRTADEVTARTGGVRAGRRAPLAFVLPAAAHLVTILLPAEVRGRAPPGPA